MMSATTGGGPVLLQQSPFALAARDRLPGLRVEVTIQVVPPAYLVPRHPLPACVAFILVVIIAVVIDLTIDLRGFTRPTMPTSALCEGRDAHYSAVETTEKLSAASTISCNSSTVLPSW